jgi:hypothetical protein
MRKTHERGSALEAEASVGPLLWPRATRSPRGGGLQWPPLPMPPVLIRTLDVAVPLMAAFSV